MHQHFIRTFVLAAVFATAGVALISAQTAPDNTKVNTRDRQKDSVTADQQKENATDRDLTQKIRRAIVKDKALSTYAHNIKIVSQDGQVTVKGPVRSESEKHIVEQLAADIAGAGHVNNQMTVAPDKS